MNIRIILAFVCTLAISNANAALIQYDFSYQLESGNTLAGSLLGTLQGDGDTIAVHSILDFVTFDGVDTINLPFTGTFSEFFATSSFATGFVSVSGNFMDFIACNSVNCVDGFLLSAPNGFGVQSGTSFGNILEDFSADSWNISAASITVPAPSTLAIFTIALIGLASRRSVRK